MSRNTTSGEDALRALSTSTPLRHSPATANSGNPANSCRTPRRAAGSSSAIKAFHLACFTVWLRTHFAIRHLQRCDCTAFGAACDLERGLVAIQRAQTFTRVLDAMTGRKSDGWIDPDSIVDHGDVQHLSHVLGSDKKQTRIGMPGDAMTYCVFHQMLQSKTRNCR